MKDDRQDLDIDLGDLDVYAYVGYDEFGVEGLGLKAAIVPAGLIPLVAIERSKIDVEYMIEQLQQQSTEFDREIRLVRLHYVETIKTILPKGRQR